MSDIFISYRREDSEGWAGRLAEKFQHEFGKDVVFYDYDSIEPSHDWKVAIKEGLRQCKLLIAVIGPKWMVATNASGTRRLDDPADLLRFELSTALQKGIPILPLLVGKAQLPRSEDLPREIQDILKYQALELQSRNAGKEIESIMELAAQVTKKPRQQPAADGTVIDVGRKLVIADSEAGSIVGTRGSRLREGVSRVSVAEGAEIRNSKLKDIVGTEIVDSRKR